MSCPIASVICGLLRLIHVEIFNAIRNPGSNEFVTYLCLREINPLESESSRVEPPNSPILTFCIGHIRLRSRKNIRRCTVTCAPRA